MSETSRSSVTPARWIRPTISRCSGRQLGAAQGVDDADDAVQRRADLVAHIGQEVGLGPVGGLGRRLGVDQGPVGGDPVGDVARHAIDAVAEPLGPPFQGAVARRRGAGSG